MSNLEIKSNAEGTTRDLISVVYYFNLIACVILLLIGIFVLPDVAEHGLFLILAGIIYIFWLTLLKSLFDTFVNISVKLDRDKDIIRELQKISLSLENMSKSKIENSKESYVNIEMNHQVNSDEVKEDKVKVENVRSEVTTALDDEILSDIIAGKEINARLLLMQKKGLSLDAAIAYINEIKDKIK